MVLVALNQEPPGYDVVVEESVAADAAAVRVGVHGTGEVATLANGVETADRPLEDDEVAVDVVEAAFHVLSDALLEVVGLGDEFVAAPLLLYLTFLIWQVICGEPVAAFLEVKDLPDLLRAARHEDAEVVGPFADVVIMSTNLVLGQVRDALT